MEIRNTFIIIILLLASLCYGAGSHISDDGIDPNQTKLFSLGNTNKRWNAFLWNCDVNFIDVNFIDATNLTMAGIVGTDGVAAPDVMTIVGGVGFIFWEPLHLRAV